MKIEEVRLAHSSVEQYLISDRPKPVDLTWFYVRKVTADQLVAESGLLYMKALAESETNVGKEMTFSNILFSVLRTAFGMIVLEEFILSKEKYLRT